MSELVELGRVVRSDIGRQGGEDIPDRDAERFGLGAVDDDVQLRRADPERRAQPLQGRLRIAISHDSLRQALQQRVIEIAVPDLDLHRETTDIADALDGGWWEREHDGLCYGMQ